VGPIAVKCPDPQKKPRCSICSKVGHEAKDCRVKVSSVAQVGAANTKEYPPIMKTIELEGREFSALESRLFQVDQFDRTDKTSTRILWINKGD